MQIVRYIVTVIFSDDVSDFLFYVREGCDLFSCIKKHYVVYSLEKHSFLKEKQGYKIGFFYTNFP